MIIYFFLKLQSRKPFLHFFQNTLFYPKTFTKKNKTETQKRKKSEQTLPFPKKKTKFWKTHLGTTKI